MTEVDIHRPLLLDLQLLSYLDVIPNLFGLTQLARIIIKLVCVHLVVGIFRAQHEVLQEVVELSADAPTHCVLVLVVDPLMQAG